MEITCCVSLCTAAPFPQKNQKGFLSDFVEGMGGRTQANVALMKKCQATRYAYITFSRYYLVCFPAVFNQLRSHLSLLWCYIFSPAVDVRWEHTAKTRFCHNLMSQYF